MRCRNLCVVSTQLLCVHSAWGRSMAEALTVLVVDDDELMLDLAVAALDSLGFGRISAALSGDHGLRILDEVGADMVLCDLNMPEMDGVEFLRHLAARRYEGCIVLMSGEDQRILRTAESLAKAHGLKVLGACEKPIRASVLAQMRDQIEPLHRRSSAPAPAPITVTADELRQAIIDDEIAVFFQPKVCVRSGRVTGVETLARWKHKLYGYIPPQQFIAIAERENLI